MALDPIYKAVGFDMDGTFINSVIDYVKLANIEIDELASMGVPETVIGTHGDYVENAVEWMQRKGIDIDVRTVRRNIQNRATDVELEHADLAVPFDGAKEVTDMLRGKGYKVGLLTRGGHRYAVHVLTLTGTLDCFDAIVARDDFPEEEMKPSPKAMMNLANALGVSANEIMYLGDHKFDWFTARDSGAGFCGVTTGKFKEEDWYRTDKNIRVLSSIKDLLGLL